MTSASIYGQPALYDLLFLGWSADLAHYLAVAERHPAPVILECAVGTGRIAIPLARAGHPVHGVDRSPAMLAALAARLAGEPAEVRGRVTFAEGDLRQLATGRTYGLVLAPFNAVGHLLLDDDLDAFLAAVAGELLPGGVFAFDVWLPSPETLAGRVTESPRFRDPRTAAPMRCTERTGIDPATGLLHLELALHGLDGDPPERFLDAVRLRDAATLHASLARQGLVAFELSDLGEMQGWMCRAG